METLTKYLKKENIEISLLGKTREELYMELLTLLEKRSEIQDKSFILKSIITRDKVIDSYMGKGVIFVRLPLETQKNISLTMGIKKEGLDEEVFDREKIRIFLIIITPDSANEEYINLVSEMSNLLNQGSIREDILDAKDAERVKKILLGQ
ncbi:PTS system fructose-specific EIIABC component [subsurface metagenome]